MKLIKVVKVFTPSSPAELTYVNRRGSEKQFKRALRTIGKQIIVYGHSGCGKSTMIVNILNKLNTKYITTRCTKGISIESVILDAFSQLGTFYIEQKESLEENTLSGRVKVGFNLLSIFANASSKGADKEIQKRIVEIQKNPHQLANAFGSTGYLWVIEDFHKLDSEPKKELSQIMKVFMDVSHEFEYLKIIAVGAVDSARNVVHYDSEMTNRVSEVHVPLMNPKETNLIMSQGENLLNINIYDSVKSRIVAYSSGLASVTHQLCDLLCESIGVNETSVKLKHVKQDDLEYAINEFVNEKSDSLKSIYELALKDKIKRRVDTSQNIIVSILKLHKESFSISEIASLMRDSFKNYKSNSLKKHVHELTSPNKGEILRFNRNADTYAFSNPFIRGYCHIHLIKYQEKRTDKLHIEYRNSELLQEHLLAEYKQFIADLENDYLYD
ncbi:MAG: energy-coupling factor transporter ATP-binding protein EcfA2 [Spirosomataceae bacterium]|jgi:energy-coupling factor transporter ATP-binding protein EcfA2